MKTKVNCKDCRCFVNYCRKYRKYTDNCSDFIDDKKHQTMAKKKANKKKIGLTEYLLANRIGSREAELKNSTGWISKHKVHKSKKNYSRKNYKVIVE